MKDYINYLSNTKIIKGIIVLFALTVIFGYLTNSTLSGSVVFKIGEKSPDYLGLLMHLGVLALITERFVEIFTAVLRKPGRVKLEGKIRIAHDDNAKSIENEKLEEYSAQTGAFAMSISFITGLIISAVGVRILGQLFEVASLGSGVQVNYFNAIDIIITAGLIAGGSKGVNALTSSMGGVFDAMKYQSRVTQENAKKELTKK